MSDAISIDDRVYPEGHEGDADYETVCMWWARCVRPANTLKDHPVLGQVPICKPCAEKLDRLSQ
ncbi:MULTISPECIES: hypothetical protein [unclassified Mycolicibacterium]|uniref:DUF3039 domain-containing protein n=1 Tax=Mycolicibacterium sp. CBMA 213 TaxID=1968788 RepID=A0A343VRJ8_9MYCO|nr:MULTISPECIES: hypothetical protein [unclassified Mycolicibacterium]AVN58522.1 hypothetical protein B5P44_p00227 [Mycolicibacterium sp. CBMA 213]MUL61167.1 hypothetical protein [Mycolicibacterium sp. CBMA 335]